EARYVPTAHQAHHENLFVSWDEITTPFKIKKHAGHPPNISKVFQRVQFSRPYTDHMGILGELRTDGNEQRQ
ncbi:hypothetical protein, partial [Desulfovibrio piger]|uniref:hypothetical protein n=1 Tax=Desulfovibrio piger TaxID=901 RepID=UPI00195A6EBC